MKGILLFLASTFLLLNSYAQVDTTTGISAPASVSKDHVLLSKHLCEGVMNDQLKANIIFNWITNNINYDLKTEKDPEKQNPNLNEILSTKKANSNGYVKLYVAMCKQAGLSALAIEGYGKDLIYDNMDEFYLPRAGWVAVKLNGVWELVDPAGGAGYISHHPSWVKKQWNKLSKNNVNYSRKGVFVKRYNASKFMISPIEMRNDALAADPVLQLVSNPMPLSVFRMSDSAVHAYTLYNNKRVKNAQALIAMSNTERDELILEQADRIYAANPNYWVILAQKEQALASRIIKKYTSRRTVFNDKAYDDFVIAKNKLKKALRYIDTQKSHIAPHIAKLKKKNIDKNRIAKQRVRDIRIGLKSAQSKLNMRANSGARKLVVINEKLPKVMAYAKGMTHGRINTIETLSVQKEESDPLLVELLDSVDARVVRLRTYDKTIKNEIAAYSNLSDKRDEYFKNYLSLVEKSDSVFRLEAMERAVLQDNYDENIIHYTKQHDSLWGTQAKEVFQKYLDAYDTTLKQFTRLEQSYKNNIRLYKSNIRALEQYKRMNDSSETLSQVYFEIVNKYMICITDYDNLLRIQNEFYTVHAKAFTELSEHFKETEELLEYFDKVEVERKEIEALHIEDAKLYEEKELDYFKRGIEHSIKEIDDVLTEYKS